MKRGAGKRTALLAALGVAGVLALAVGWRDEIAVWWHLRKLRSEPGHLLAIAARPEGAPERRAVREHLKSPGGRGALVKAFIEQALRSIYEGTGQRTPDFSMDWWFGMGLPRDKRMAFGLMPHRGKPHVYYWEITPAGATSELSRKAVREPLLSLHGLLAGALAEGGGEESWKAGLYRLRIRREDQVPKIDPANLPFGSPANPAAAVCLVEVAEEPGSPAPDQKVQAPSGS